MTRASTFQPRLVVFATVVALALVMSQALGWVHRVAHDQGAPAARVCKEPADALLALWDQHYDEGSAECRLIDQAANADAPPADAPISPLHQARYRALPPPHVPVRGAPPVQRYRARAPPSSSLG